MLCFRDHELPSHSFLLSPFLNKPPASSNKSYLLRGKRNQRILEQNKNQWSSHKIRTLHMALKICFKHLSLIKQVKREHFHGKNSSDSTSKLKSPSALFWPLSIEAPNSIWWNPWRPSEELRRGKKIKDVQHH